MSVNELSVRYKLATKTTSEWDAISYIVPLKGEICFYSDSGKAKLGDGSTTLANLTFLWLSAAEIQALIDAVQDGTIEEAIQQIQTDLESKVPNTRKVNGYALNSDIELSADDVKAIPISVKGVGGGVAELDEHGYVPAHQLPSYVDDVIEGYLIQGVFYEDAAGQTQITPESGKLYTDISTTEYKCYRWSGSGYVVIPDSVTLGTTSATAFRGDWGKAAYDHGVVGRGNEYPEGIYKIRTNAEGHVISATKLTKNDILNLGISDTDTTYDDASETSSGLMSAADKKKLNAIEAEANKYIHPSYTGVSEGLYKVTVDTTGHVSNVTPVTKEDLSEIGIDVDAGTLTETKSGYIITMEDLLGFSSITPYGKTEQRTTKGYQLLKNPENFSNVEVGDYVCLSSDVLMKTAGAYTFTFALKNASTNGWFMSFYDSDNNVIKSKNSGTVSTNIEFTQEEVEKVTKLSVWCGRAFNGYKGDYAILNYGSTALPWEPFTDGEASPSVNYQQFMIKSGQRLVEGYQLFNDTVEDVIGSTSGTLISSSLRSVIIPITGGNTYTISIETADTIFTSTTTDYPAVDVSLVDAYAGSGGVAVKYKTVTTNANAKYLVIGFGNGVDAHYDEIMVNNGPIARPWEPYTGEKQAVVNTGKINHKLLTGNLLHPTVSLVNCTYDGNGVYSVPSSVGSVVINCNHSSLAMQEMRIPNGDVYLSLEIEATNACTVSNIFLCTQGSSINKNYLYTVNKTVANSTLKISNVFALTNDVTHFGVVIYFNEKAPEGLKIKNVQLRLGSEEKDYEPYNEQPFTSITPNGLGGIPLGQSIPDVIKNSPVHMRGVYHDGKQYWIGDIKDYTTGENVQLIWEQGCDDDNCTIADASIYVGIYENHTYYRMRCDRDFIPTNYLLCTRATAKPLWGFDVLGCYIYTNATNCIDFTVPYTTLGLSKESTTDERVAALNTWLESNDISFSCILAEPIITDISEEEMAAYNALMAYNPTTTIISEAYTEVIGLKKNNMLSHIYNTFAKKSDLPNAGLTEDQVKAIVDGKFREISKEDYNNLTEEEKNNGTIYFITDGETGDNVVDIISGNGIFIATAETTTYNEIKTAFDEGKHIFCKEEVDTDSYIIYSLVDFNYDKFIFSATTSERIQFFTVNSSGWTSSYKDIDSSSAPFIATYRETPFGDIYNAYTSGRVVFVEFLEGIEIIRACLNKDVSSVELCFSATTSDGIYLFKVTETDEWSYELESFEALSNLLASI